MLSFALGVPAVSAKVLKLAPASWMSADLDAPSPEALAAARDAQDAAILAEVPTPVAQALRQSSARHGVPLALVEAVAWQESRFRQEAVSPRGALGVMQLTPATADTLDVDPRDMAANIDGGCAYLAKLIDRFGDTRLALAAYNAGPNKVARYGGVPPYEETQTYVAAIMARVENGPGAA